jgi:hypothetical protein
MDKEKTSSTLLSLKTAGEGDALGNAASAIARLGDSMQPTSSEKAAQAEKPLSALAGLKDKSLKTAGYSYLIGDAAFAAAKLMEGDKSGAYGASLWGLGGLAAARYGNPSAEKELELLQRRLGAYIKKQHIKIPAGADTRALAKDSGIVDQVEAFLYSYPSQMLNAVYAVGGALTLKGGIQKNNYMDIASGALITAGAIAGLLIQEKKPDPDHPAETALGKLKEWAQAKPLRVSGTLYHINNASMLIGAYQQIDKNKASGSKSHWLRFLTAGSYILANTMLSLSSKEAGTASSAAQDQETLRKLSEQTAAVIAAQPEELQLALVDNISGYLAAQPEIQFSAKEISSMLTQKLNAAKQAQGSGWVSRATSSPQPISPSLG